MRWGWSSSLFHVWAVQGQPELGKYENYFHKQHRWARLKKNIFISYLCVFVLPLSNHSGILCPVQVLTTSQRGVGAASMDWAGYRWWDHAHTELLFSYTAAPKELIVSCLVVLQLSLLTVSNSFEVSVSTQVSNGLRIWPFNSVWRVMFQMLLHCCF